MTRIAAAAACFLLISMSSGPAIAEDALSVADYQWLAANMSVRRDNAAVVMLTDAQKARLHAMILDGKKNIDVKRQAIAQYLGNLTAESFAATLRQSERPAASLNSTAER